MTRRLRIEWSSGSKVTGLLAGPGEGPTGVLLAHGAGGGQRHPFMDGLRRRLGAADLPTLSFDYPYMEAGRKAPDRLDRMVACHAAAYERLAERVDTVIVAGKSMGGRVGGHFVVETDADAAGLVFFGYPLVPIGKTEPRDTSHLLTSAVAMMFIQGERDRLGPPDLVRRVADSTPSASLVIVADADHGFSVPKRTGLHQNDVFDLLTDLTIGFTASVTKH